MLCCNLCQLVPKRQIYPGGVGSGFLDSEPGPSDGLAGRKVFDFNGGPNDADEVDCVTKLLLPWDLGRPSELGSSRLVMKSVIVSVVGGAFDTALELELSGDEGHS